MSNTKVNGGVIHFNPQNLGVLYKSFMPFIKNFGLFIPTNKKYTMGDQVFVLIDLSSIEESAGNNKLSAMGKVVWVFRSGSLLKPNGVGIQLLDTEDNKNVSDTIETLITGMNFDEPTYTM